jgi:hypothetical protein
MMIEPSSKYRMPFLLQFGESLTKEPAPDIRYDFQRQVVQVQVRGAWLDSTDTTDDLPWGVTLKTCVKNETTDDE